LRICESAEEALEILTAASHDFDLIAVDFDLPGMSGLQFCRQLLGQGISLPFVLFAPEGFETLLNTALQSGIEACLLKPTNSGQFSVLPAALQEIARHHQDRLLREKAVEGLRDNLKRLKRIIEASTVPTFVIDNEHKITDWNKACASLTGLSAKNMLGTKDTWRAFYSSSRPTMVDLVVDGLIEEELAKHSCDTYRKSPLGEGYEAEDYFPAFAEKGGWLFITAAPLQGRSGRTVGAIATLQNVTKSKIAVEKLEQTATWLTQILNSSTVPTFVIDNHHRLTHWNHACQMLTGVPADKVIGTTHQWRAFYPQARPTMADLIVDDVLEGEISKHYTSGYRRSLLGNGWEAEGFFPHLGAEGRWLFFTAAPLRSASGKIVGAQETLQDITGYRKAENALAESRHWLSQIIQGSAVPTFVIDQEHRIREWNIACERMTGIKAEKMIGTRDQWKAFSDHERPVLADFILNEASEEEIARQYGNKYRRSLVGEGYEVEDFFPALEKEGKWLFFTASPLRDAAGRTIGAIETLQDITRRRKAEEALRASEQKYRELSMTDDLTGLFNARYLYLRAVEEIDRAERYEHPLCLIMLDLDDFKSYNDTHGHLQGDLVLQRLAHTIKRCIRKTDSAFRYSGEEFMVLLPESTLNKAIEIAERIRWEFSGEIFSPEPGTAIRKTVSIGAARFISGEKAQALLSRADRNMYRAKRGGKNQVDAGGEETSFK
jgi:diguanylate cyclase (GGDEF)-like protein/PAS domain S-box-containing protein